MDHDSNTPREQMKAIINGMCAGNASMATDAILAEFVIIPRNEVPEVSISDHVDIGLVTALAQQRYQPSLTLAEEDGDKTDGTWNRSIASANLAIAEAVERQSSATEAKRNARRDELAGIYFPEVCYGELKATGYATLKPGIKAAVDRIIELEEAAA
ncbi:hypothetical protein ASF21_12775 [Arthrobacter sp. Leaf234]|uniref:hypothetical protein n=1 Tax=Arthrobacter sp. Leaf234 TaxID=1736303 RepID=UPI0006F6D1DA|nr:hypothetical protein [Arthrobacter sp. Leaf234]KQN99675.1 hypothetical protein ASF21_12775 [Arthrobacter sp. Leaf234]